MNGDKDKPKTIGQMLFMAGIAGAVPILTYSVQYGELKTKVDVMEQHTKHFPHPPPDFRALIDQKIQVLDAELKAEIKELDRRLDLHERYIHKE